MDLKKQEEVHSSARDNFDRKTSERATDMWLFYCTYKYNKSIWCKMLIL